MGFVDLLFPKYCLGCREQSFYLCPKCISKVPHVTQKCIFCQKPSVDGFTHVKCKKTFGLDGSVSVFSYDKIVRDGIIKLKYKFVYEMASELSDYMGQFLRRNITALPKQALLVPVPLHPKRERWRGFNQSEKLGRIIGRYMGWKVISNLLIRTKLTRPQVELSGDERRKNLKGVFVINPKISIPLSAYNTPVILFDDVITTGATVKEAGKVLKRIGFKNVWGLSVAS